MIFLPVALYLIVKSSSFLFTCYKHLYSSYSEPCFVAGFVIFKCGLNCRPVSHFHCPKCCKLLEKKNRFVDHLNKCVGTVTGEGGGPVKQEADSHHVPEGEENIQAPETKVGKLTLGLLFLFITQ